MWNWKGVNMSSLLYVCDYGVTIPFALFDVTVFGEFSDSLGKLTSQETWRCLENMACND